VKRAETVVIERGGRKMRLAVIPSRRSTMTRPEYTLHALAEAGAYGSAAVYWVKDVDAGQARRLARLAAHWAMKVTG
jgi:hypothetical protein